VALPADADVRRGDRVTLCIRPEVVGVSSLGGGTSTADGAGDATGPSARRTGDGGGTAPAPRSGADRRTAIDATVESTEFLGHAYRVHCDWHGRALLATVPATGRSEPPAGAVRLWIDAETVHVLRD
jgi:thiamine transport system ATP-binding protein